MKRIKYIKGQIYQIVEPYNYDSSSYSTCKGCIFKILSKKRKSGLGSDSEYETLIIKANISGCFAKDKKCSIYGSDIIKPLSKIELELLGVSDEKR